jgi:GNAT superfamily N-acetyltransferase
MADLIVDVSPTAPEGAPLVEDLLREYDKRYGTRFDAEGARAEVFSHPAEDFEPPHGAYLLLRRDGRTIGGGAFRRLDETTAEFKRIWTHSDFRRQGLARKIVRALEEKAAARGYTRVFMTTAFRQPEAVGLYLGLGYRPLFDPALDPELYLVLPFEKHIGALAGTPGTSPLRIPGDYPPELAHAAPKRPIEIPRDSGASR